MPQDFARCSILHVGHQECIEEEGVRHIAASAVFQRLVAKSLARQFGNYVEEARSPFQFALFMRARVDCVGHTIRMVTNADHSASEPIASILAKLLEVPKLQQLLLFVRKTYGAPSCYKWEDADGQHYPIWQHEDGKQRDPLMPLLFQLGHTQRFVGCLKPAAGW